MRQNSAAPGLEPVGTSAGGDGSRMALPFGDCGSPRVWDWKTGPDQNRPSKISAEIFFENFFRKFFSEIFFEIFFRKFFRIFIPSQAVGKEGKWALVAS